MWNKAAFTILLALSTSLAAKAQEKSWEYKQPDFSEPTGFSLGFNVGMSDLWGDVGTKGIIDHYNNSKYWHSPNFMGGTYIRYSIIPAVALRLGTNFGQLYADDNWNYTKAKKATSIEDDAYQRYARNLNVKDVMWEGNLLLEINPFRFNQESKSARRRFQPYLLTGITCFHFESKGELIDRVTGRKQWVNLYDLDIEGNGFSDYPDAPKKYKQWQVAVPLGIGARWDIGDKLGLGVEYMYRLCFTDYLDGVSDRYVDPALYTEHLSPANAYLATQLEDKSWLIEPGYKAVPGTLRGNKAVNDGYSTISVSFFYRLKGRRTPWWF